MRFSGGEKLMPGVLHRDIGPKDQHCPGRDAETGFCRPECHALAVGSNDIEGRVCLCGDLSAGIYEFQAFLPFAFISQLCTALAYGLNPGFEIRNAHSQGPFMKNDSVLMVSAEALICC